MFSKFENLSFMLSFLSINIQRSYSDANIDLEESASHPLTPPEGVPQVRNGAKHSPPGDQVTPDWLRGGSSSLYSGPPFDSRYLQLKSMKQNNLKWIIIVFDALSNDSC